MLKTGDFVIINTAYFQTTTHEHRVGEVCVVIEEESSPCYWADIDHCMVRSLRTNEEFGWRRDFFDLYIPTDLEKELYGI